MERYQEKLDREQKGASKWNERFGPELGLRLDGTRETDSRLPSIEEASVAIVIMGGASSSGDEPEDMLVIRMERAIAEWWNGKTNTVIVTTGRRSARIMRDMLVHHGCPERVVHVEDTGGSTIEQAHNVANMLKGTNVKIIKLVTSEFHNMRS